MPHHPTPPDMEAVAARLEELAKEATPGPWVWHTSCSWRRLKHESRGLRLNVAEPFVARDGHPDLDVKQEDMAFISAANPETVLALLSERRQLIEALESIWDVSERMNSDQAFNSAGRLSRCAEHARAALTGRKS